MGYFKDAYDIGAGATLGSLVSNAGFNLGMQFTSTAVKVAYEKYRTQHFDPIVRMDLKEIMVKNRMNEMVYPFPGVKGIKKNFIKRHPIVTGLFIASTVLGLISKGSGMIADLSSSASALFIICAFGLIFKKLGSLGKKAVDVMYKTQLENDGAQYWYVREYVRQALDSGELNERDAMIKLLNTRLVQQFPDTVDEIDANAFYYRQELGL